MKMNKSQTLTFSSISDYLLNNPTFINTLRIKLNNPEQSPTTKTNHKQHIVP